MSIADDREREMFAVWKNAFNFCLNGVITITKKDVENATERANEAVAAFQKTFP